MNNDLTVLRVLYVEDNPADAELAQRVLARVAPWIDLDIASTIAEAKATLQQAELPDVLATDLHLADGSGIELVSWLRTCGLALPVVVLTASGNHQSALTALRAGADDYLTKHGDYLQRLPRILREARERRLRRKAFMGASVRVLFVDADDAEIARVRDCLARSTPNIQVEVAHTIAEALAFLPADAAPAVDLLLISQALPDGDGLELAHVLRVERGIGLPVVLLADQRSEALIVRAAHEGVDDYLVRHDAYLHELPATLEKVHRQAVIARERVQYLNAQGQLITESLRDYTRINLTRRFDSLDRFLQAWSDADRKAALLAELEGQGVLIDALADEVGRDLDPFDLLLHVAWNMPPLTRRERARRARTSSVFTQYGLVARKVLDALLDKYADEGLATIEADNVLSIQPFTELGSPAELVRSFGGRPQYLRAVRTLEQALYKPESDRPAA